MNLPENFRFKTVCNGDTIYVTKIAKLW